MSSNGGLTTRAAYEAAARAGRVELILPTPATYAAAMAALKDVTEKMAAKNAGRVIGRPAPGRQVRP